MIKKEYFRPAMTVSAIDVDAVLLVKSVKTNGLGDDKLENDGSGNSWNDAMSPGYDNWDEEEDW